MCFIIGAWFRSSIVVFPILALQSMYLLFIIRVKPYLFTYQNVSVMLNQIVSMIWVIVVLIRQHIALNEFVMTIVVYAMVAALYCCVLNGYVRLVIHYRCNDEAITRES